MKLRSVLFLLLLPACAAISSEPAGSRATFSFSPTEVHATRSPVHARCGEKDARFTDDDIFSLVPVSADAPYGIRGIALSFHRTVIKGSALELVRDAPGGALSSPERASSPDRTNGVELFVHGNPTSVLSRATVTMIDVPTKDGDATSAHVTIEFADGAILDETFTGLLVSNDGACAAGG